MLYSQRSNPMLEIVEDTCGRHDFLMTPCSLRGFQIEYGNKEYHPSCHENLSRVFAGHKILHDHIATTFNIFMNVVVDADGKIAIHPPKSKPGDFVVFKAHMDLLVGLTACSHENTNAGVLKPIHYQVYS